MPRIVGINEYEENAKIARMAEEAGFIVLDLSDVYDNHDIDSIRLTAWDWHSNAIGQQLIADRLYETL